ncbi:polyprenyl synthetase family protein [Asticcacaulis sp. AC402]|uniref:polyprenyl synthetase family protein n=1 Tax=Asticcacaulis sp. AC402 TaxID=1282361 RepID=UPI0003C3F1C4|nr:polyprenyl synthetase family protein [Asticcacaulis sp. AC402]ESQ74102.1 farnesyltranstransferase [Asticcacaulis sp. AC402]
MDSANIETVRAPVAKADVNALIGLTAADMIKVNSLITARMQSEVPVIPALADHLIAAGGKRLRPLLCVAAARLCDVRNDNHHRLAAAVEFIHTATLLHDDVVDSSSLRRGKVAAHLIWGAPSSVLVGDFLFARAFELMVETGSLRALDILSKAAAVITQGEVLQLMKAFDLNLSQADYIEIISSKTAALFSAASESGAVSAGASEDRITALYSYGLNLGLAFQIQDDVLDYQGDAADLGKNAGDDFAEGKSTLPLILVMQATKGSEDAFWARTIGERKQQVGDFAHAQKLMIKSGALEQSRAIARGYADKARAALSIFDPGAWRTALENLALFSVERQT